MNHQEKLILEAISTIWFEIHSCVAGTYAMRFRYFPETRLIKFQVMKSNTGLYQIRENTAVIEHYLSMDYLITHMRGHLKTNPKAPYYTPVHMVFEQSLATLQSHDKRCSYKAIRMQAPSN